MKKFFALLLTATMLISLTACGSGNTETSSTETTETSSSETTETAEADTTAEVETETEPEEKEPVTLRFYNYALSETAKADWWQSTIDNFMAEYDWVTIEPIVVDYNSMITTFTNDLASGLSVDMIFGEGSWVSTLAEGGFLAPLDEVVDADFYAGYYDFVLEQETYNGEVYGAPLYYSPWILYVNKDLVEAAGLSMDDFPTTLDGLKEWNEILAEYYAGDESITTTLGFTTAEVSATGSCIASVLASFGGTLVNDDGTLADMTSDPNLTAMTEMLEFYDYLIDGGYTQENLKLKDYRASFGAGNVCMYIDQAWGYAQIGEVDANAMDFTVSAPLPTTMGTYGTGASNISIQNIMVGSGLSENQLEAVNLFIQYVTSTESLEQYINEVNPAFIAHEGMEDCELPSILDGAATGADNVVSYVPIASLTSVQTQLATMVLNYTVNGMSLEDAISDYVTQAEYYINQ
ncbi:MAG: extracellular solute-binding protein [Lachnospiraceae bacterium]|nr:extracellular solute-binding protein [Lachnospiraceae bacterium]